METAYVKALSSVQTMHGHNMCCKQQSKASSMVTHSVLVDNKCDAHLS